MVNPNQAEDLLMPLLVRAHAVQVWPQLGFVDRAAEYVVRTLDLDRPGWDDTRRFFPQHQLVLQRCKWIDNEVRDFLATYPEAMGIELGAGLSTRFQRLSARSDWPRFSWVDVDAVDVIDCADLIFPRTDNYRLVASDIVRDDWLQKSGWHADRPLIVIIEALPDGACLRDLKNILAPLFNAVSGFNVVSNVNEVAKVNAVSNNKFPVHLVLDYASPTLQKIRNQLRCMMYGMSCCGFADARDLLERLDFPGRVLHEQDLAAASAGPFLHRLLAQLYRRFTRKCFWGAAHIRLDANR